ncbi:MAG TPA: hypothetical protein VFP10_13315, partial [Candidatus Eisenbacteria bacterium]|nr:hypothetical protein [Candidatus Eisenbacteria bacterium]
MKKTLAERIEALDRRWVFLLMFLAMSGPLLIRVVLPLRVSPESRGYYEAIENLEPGDIVFLPSDYDPGGKAELDPMLLATLDHLFRQDVRIVGVSLWPAGPPLLERAFNAIAPARNKVYGVDYIHMGFKEGKENVMVQLGKSFRELFPVDYYGTPLDSLPLMHSGGVNGAPIDKLSDTKLLVNISIGYPGTREWVQQVRGRYQMKMVSGCAAVSAPEYFPYVQSGQLSGLLGGLSGAAE